MTNLSDSAVAGLSPQKSAQVQKQPLIPPARIRTSQSSRGSNFQAASKKPHHLQQRQPSAMENTAPAPEVWASVDELFWDHMKEVENKWSTLKLNDDIWAKLIYFEQNCRLAKAYVSAPMLTIDGSSHGLDGFRIGLTGIDNTYRNLDSVRCLRSIGMGVKLKIDNQGNILIRRVGQSANAAARQCSVWVKDWPSGGSPVDSLAETCTIRELDLSDTSYKLFDMRKFRLQLEKRKLVSSENLMDWRQCVSIISFVNLTNGKRPSSSKLLEDPCWLMLINIIAIDMLKCSLRDRSQSPVSLIQQHQVGKASPNDKSRARLGAPPAAPLRASSSASILMPSQQANKEPGAQIPAPDATGGGLAGASERVKKLRTTTSPHKLSPVKDAAPYNQYRRYQSTQQLSSNLSNSGSSGHNTIYTTFNTRLFGPRVSRRLNPLDTSSTSDYNFAAHSTSSVGHPNYWPPRPTALYASPLDSCRRASGQLNFRPSRVDKARTRLNFSRSSAPSLEPKSLSLSTFDLSQRRLDLRSSIKMNYDDNVPESEDTFDHLPSTTQSSFKLNSERSSSSGRRSSSALNNRVSSDPKLAMTSELAGEELKLDISREHVNHNQCPAMQDPAAQVLPAHQLQEVSRNSIDSSSSSSGCADNDYFMSHSSSSMSSSASNERELFSQRASSSGIVCSGNTSDEYDEARKLSVHDGEIIAKRSGSPGKLEKPELEQKQKSSKEPLVPKLVPGSGHHRRGYKIKTIEPDGGYCCGRLPAHDDYQDDCDCDCPTVELGCDCCCSCFFEPTINTKTNTSTTTTTNTRLSASQVDDEESIYSRLPHPAQVAGTKQSASSTTTTNNKSRSTKATRDKDNALLAAQRGDGSGSRLSSSRLSLSSSPRKVASAKSGEYVDVSAAAHLHQSEKSTKDLKQTNGWLEKRKYSKILPKFIFSSSASNRQASGRLGEGGITQQQKSSTLDKDGKYRLIRSTQNLLE